MAQLKCPGCFKPKDQCVCQDQQDPMGSLAAALEEGLKEIGLGALQGAARKVDEMAARELAKKGKGPAPPDPTAPPGSENAQDLVECPVCHTMVPESHLGRHVREAHQS